MQQRLAAKTPRDLPGNGWYEILPPPEPARELSGESDADWVIVGAGFAGLSAARRLSELRTGERIVLIDAQRVGWGASGRNSGFMIDLPHQLNSESYTGDIESDQSEIRMNRAAIEFAAAMAEEFGLERFFSRRGKYHGAATASGVRALATFAQHLDRLGEKYTLLDQREMQTVTGSAYYRAGVHAPGAAIIHPAGFVRGIAEKLKDRIELYESSPVIGIETGTKHIVRTAAGAVRTPRVILATNGHVQSFGFYQRQLMHVFTFASMTRPLTDGEQRRLGGAPEWALVSTDPMGSTARRLREGRILIRNTFTYNPDMETSERQVERLRARHRRSFGARFPTLCDVPFEYSWGGHLCFSLNSVPAFGEIEEQVFSAACCNGLGTVKSTLAGKLIAELATGLRTPLLDEMLSLPKPSRLHPEPLMGLAARLYLWWTHLRAGREL